MSEEFSQKKEALKERIKAAEENKKKVTGIMQKLAAKYSIGEISYQDYHETVAKTFGKKTPQQWVDYYDSYIEQCGNLLSRFDREGTFNKIKKVGILLVPLILLFVLVFAGYNVYKNVSFTGLTVAVDKEEHSDNVGFEKRNSGEETWTPAFNGALESLKASGVIEGDGRVRVYLDDELILDSDNIEVTERAPITGNFITGFSTEGGSEGDGGESGGESGGSGESLSSGDSGGSLSSDGDSSGGDGGSSGGDGSFSGSESGGDSGTSEGTGDLGNNGESGTGEGDSGEGTGEEAPEEQNETGEGGDGTGGQQENETTGGETEGEVQGKAIKRFEDICANTCSLDGITKDSYNIRFEVEGEVSIKVSKFAYEVLVEGKEKEEKEKNETEKEVKNETEKNESKIEPIPEINITGPPVLIREIPEIKIEVNGFVELKLEEYFENADEFFLLQVQNISTTAFDHTIKIQPDENFTGIREAKIIASNKFGTIESNLFNISVEDVSELPPALIKEIPEIKIPLNGRAEIKLEEYFFNADEFFFLQTQNISTTTYDHTIVLQPDKDFTGVRESKIIASNEFGNFESNFFNISVGDLNVTDILNLTLNETGNVSITLLQYKAIINKPTKWIKNVDANDPEELKELLVEIPKESENISIIPVQGIDEALADIKQFETEIENTDKGEIVSGSLITGNVAFESDEKKGILTRIWEFITRGGITGRVVDGNNETNDDIIEEEDRKLVNLTATVLATNTSDVNIEYYTSGPRAIEEETPNGKKVFVSGDDKLNYTEILAFTQIPELRNVGEESQIKVFWIEQNKFVDFGTADLDGNGKIDYIEWIVPHLSNQTFEIILITKAEHLDENKTVISDIYDSVFELDGNWSETIPETHYVRVTFEQNLTSVNDITIFPRVVNGTPRIEVYEFNQSELIATFENITGNEYNKIYLDGSSGAGLGNRTQDTFDLLILNGSVEFDHIIDPTFSLSRIYNFEDLSDKKAYCYTQGTDTPNNPGTGYYEWNVSGTNPRCSNSYSNIAANDNFRESDDAAPISVDAWVNQWFNFTIAEPVANITAISVKWIGYDKLDESDDFEFDIWNYSSGSWLVINTTTTAKSSDVVYGTTFGAGTNFSQFINGRELRLAVSGDKSLVPICLAPDTLVNTKNGDKKISEINKGDVIYSYNEKTGEIEEDEVVGFGNRSISNYGNKYYYIYYGNFENEREGLVKSTNQHLFYTNEGYVFAQDLKVGDKLLDVDGGEKKITAIDVVNNSEDYVWWIDAKNNNNFFAGGVLTRDYSKEEDLYSLINQWKMSSSFVYSIGDNGTESYEGRVLGKYDTKTKENYDEIRLHYLDWQKPFIKMKNELKEIEYIDYVALNVTYLNFTDNSEFSILQKPVEIVGYGLDKIESSDGNYLVLSEGEEAVMYFDNLGIIGTKIISKDLIVRGYYSKLSGWKPKALTHHTLFTNYVEVKIYYTGSTGMASDASNLNNITTEVNFSHLSIGSNTESLINTSNLFLYLPFDTNSTITTYDYAGGLSGTYTNGAYYTASGIIGGGLALDGINDFLEFGPDGNIAEAWPHLTVSVWVKKTLADIAANQHIFDKTGAGMDTFELFIGGNDRPQFTVYNSSGNGIGGGAADVVISDTGWHHLVGVYNGTAVFLYKDGTASSTVGSLRGLTPSSANDLNIGTRSSGSTNNFNGTIDEVMILNYSMSAAEVTSLYTNQSTRFFGRGEQVIKNLNVSSLGTENRINITINATMNHDSMINVSVGDVSGDSYAYGNEYNFSNGMITNIPITTPNNISLKFIFYSGNDTSKFISPTLEDSIKVDSYAIAGGDTTTPTVNLLSPTNGSSTLVSNVYFVSHVTDNVNVSNATLYIWNSTNSLIGTNFTLAGNSSITLNVSFTLNYTGTFFWNYLAYDNATTSNKAFNHSNFTLVYEGATIPYVTLNSPANHSIYSTDVFNLTLNSTVKDDSGTIDVFVYGVSAGNTTNFYKHGLLYQRLGVANNTEIVYNWTAPVIIPSGNTILLLHLDNRSAYGENQTYAVDFSNFGNNGSAAGDAYPNLTGGYLGGGWTFDGIGNGDEISIPHSNVFNVSSLTIAAWIYPTEGKTAAAEIVSKDTIGAAEGGASGFVFGLNYRTNTTYFDPGNDVLSSSDEAVFARNTWTHIAVAANSSTVNLYINGVLNKTHVGSYSILNNTVSLNIGGSDGGQIGASGFNGTLDEVAVYNKALVDSEIKNLYRLNADKYFWKVNVTDSTGSNNESATLDLIVRGTQVVVEDTVSCSELLTHVNTIEYGYTCTDSAYSTCVGLNADLNITSKGVLTLPNTCEIFFNSTAGDGIRSFVVHGILNMNGGNVTALNASNKFNFTTFPEEPITRAGSGNISFANIGRRMNVTDSIMNFVNVDIENPIILLNSTDIDTYTIISGGSLTRRFRLNLTVYSAGATLVDVNVTAYNRSRSFIFGLSTGSDGAVYYNLTQYFDSGSGKSYWNNYTFNISKLGYMKNDTSLNITADTALSTSMESFNLITVSTTETPHNIFSRIDDSTVFNNFSDTTRPCRYVSTATINVTSTGKLVLESCTLEINSTTNDGQYDLFILGQLVANYSNITRGNSKNYEFILDTDSGSQILNSFISFTGKSAIKGQRGLEIYSNNLTFRNNTLMRAWEANAEIFANRVELTSSRFVVPTGSTNYNLYILSNDSRIVDSNLSSAALADIVLDPAANVTVLNSNYSSHSISGTAGATLYRQWYVDVFVRDTTGNAIANATVYFNNRTNDFIFSVLTNSSGNIIRQNVTEYFANSTAKNYETNYTVNVTKLGYGEEVQSLNLSNSANLTFITLSNPAPSFTIHSLTNASYFNITDSNATLNITSYDVKSDLVDIFVYGVNSTSTANFYKHGLIAQRIGARNGTQIFYNWTAPVIVPDGNTILLLHLDNRSAYGENQTYAVDFSNYGNNGTLLGDARPNMTGGYLAGGWEFDGFGNADYLSVPHSNLFDVSQMTISAWIKPYALGSSGYILSKDTALNTGYYFQFDYSNNRTIFTPGVAEYYSENGSVIKDSWTHVAVTANSTTINFYINGILNKTYTGSYSLVNTTSAIRIGATQGIGGQPAGFNGTLDEIAMYNRLLSDSEVKDIYRLNANKYFWKVNVTDQGAGNSNESETREFTIQGNNAPIINYVEPIAAVSPTENGVTYVTFKFTATDTNGIGDLNGATARGNFSKVGEELRQNSSCFAVSGESTSVTQNYSCVIDMWYYDSSGSWNVTATIADSSGSAALNTTTTFTYNQLQAIVVSPNSLTWDTFAQGAVNQTATNDPTLINNTGNYNPSLVTVKGFNLHGQTVSSEFIGVGNFTVDIETGGLPPAECFGNVLINGTAVSITGATLNRGNNSINDGSSGQEQFYYCFNEVPRLSSQVYSTTYTGGSWQISILAALFGVRRRKKKKTAEELDEIFESALDDKGRKAIQDILDADEKLRKEHDVSVAELLSFAKKKRLSQLSLEIPIDIFASEISPAEALCKYLKEQKGFSYSEIATLLNRDQRTVWINYRNAAEKNYEEFKIKKRTVNISLNILRDRRLSVLESIVHYLRTQNMKNADIARLLNKDPRNVWTLYMRAVRKMRLS